MSSINISTSGFGHRKFILTDIYLNWAKGKILAGSRKRDYFQIYAWEVI